MARLIVQNSMYSVKVESIDKQHQVIFDTIDRLHQALGEGQGKSVVKRVLDELVAYTVKHFASEEAVLQHQNYPQLAEHKLEHKKLLDKVRDFQKQYEAGIPDVALNLMSFLMAWLREHILSTDRKYSDFLIQRGVH